MEEHIRSAYFLRVATALFGVFGSIGLGTAMGLYGVMSYAADGAGARSASGMARGAP
jgi:hypothetical protein